MTDQILTHKRLRWWLKRRRAYVRMQGTSDVYIDISRRRAMEIFEAVGGDVALFVSGLDIEIAANATYLYGAPGIYVDGERHA